MTASRAGKPDGRPITEVAVRVNADFTDRATPAELLAVAARTRNDLDIPSAAALPELAVGRHGVACCSRGAAAAIWTRARSPDVVTRRALTGYE